MHEDDLRNALRTTMTIDQPPPMTSADIIRSGKRAVRRRTAIASAAAIAAIAVAAPTAYALNQGPPNIGTAGMLDPVAHAGPHYEQGVKLLDLVLEDVPAGFTAAGNGLPDGTPTRGHRATAEGDPVGTSWRYTAHTMITDKNGKTGSFLVEVRTPGNGLDGDLCTVARAFGSPDDTCRRVYAGDFETAVVTSKTVPRAMDQWAASRYYDGTIVFAAQSRGKLPNLPMSAQELGARAADGRFYLG
uniref:hypothetical protein n=1 Tax=Paractinoplanes polyasparticus TaxID=2856853 RepID=UPI001C84E791|nr:hypothetical protein [Actinoplanes polyasparticus]